MAAIEKGYKKSTTATCASVKASRQQSKMKTQSVLELKIQVGKARYNCGYCRAILNFNVAMIYINAPNLPW